MLLLAVLALAVVVVLFPRPSFDSLPPLLPHSILKIRMIAVSCYWPNTNTTKQIAISCYWLITNTTKQLGADTTATAYMARLPLIIRI